MNRKFYTTDNLNPILKRLPPELQRAVVARLNDPKYTPPAERVATSSSQPSSSQTEYSPITGYPLERPKSLTTATRLPSEHAKELQKEAELLLEQGDEEGAKKLIRQAIEELNAIIDSYTTAGHDNATKPVTPKPVPSLTSRSTLSYPSGTQHGKPLPSVTEQLGEAHEVTPGERALAGMQLNAENMAKLQNVDMETWTREMSFDDRDQATKMLQNDPTAFLSPFRTIGKINSEVLEKRKEWARNWIAQRGGWGALSDEQRAVIAKLSNGQELGAEELDILK